MNIAALMSNIGPSQKAFYMIKEFNELVKDPTNCCAVFIELMGVCVIKPLFSCYNVAFFPEHHGIAIATSIHDANSMLKTSNNADKYLYLWDMEWLEHPMNYNETVNILRNDNLKIIARSDSHAKVIENFCNKGPIGIVDNWNRHQIQTILESQND